MRPFAGFLLLLFPALLASCQTPSSERPSVSLDEVKAEEWEGIATAEDKARLGRLDQAWAQALAEARKDGAGRQIAAEGDLLKPAASLARAAPPPGSYQCRLIRIGAVGRQARALSVFKPFFCFVGVEGEQLSITKQTGSQRPGGYLWDTADTKRLIFLGTTAIGDEDVPLPYGQNSARDLAGVFERYGNLRYRLVVPWPRDGSKLNVFEFIPTPNQL